MTVHAQGVLLMPHRDRTTRSACRQRDERAARGPRRSAATRALGESLVARYTETGAGTGLCDYAPEVGACNARSCRDEDKPVHCFCAQNRPICERPAKRVGGSASA